VCIYLDWIFLAAERNQWRILCHHIMKLRVLLKTVKETTSVLVTLGHWITYFIINNETIKKRSSHKHITRDINIMYFRSHSYCFLKIWAWKAVTFVVLCNFPAFINIFNYALLRLVWRYQELWRIFNDSLNIFSPLIAMWFNV